MLVLLDTDVILDVLLARQPYATDSRKVWELCATGELTGYVSGITPLNVFYIARKSVGGIAARQYVIDILMIMQIAAVDSWVLQNALDLPMTDIEDAVQSSAAQAIGVNLIITRNLDDYTASPIQAVNPTQLLERLNNSLLT
jgi:predicted nucleic acid-binding protein